MLKLSYLLDDFTEYPSNNLDYAHVTWAQLKEMSDSGLVEVQNYTYNLHQMSNGRIGCTQKPTESFSHYQQVLSEDIEKVQDKIIMWTGKAPNTFAYPYGKSSKNTDLILKQIGFKATLSCDVGINLIKQESDELYGLKRLERSHGKRMEKLLKEGEEDLKYQ